MLEKIGEMIPQPGVMTEKIWEMIPQIRVMV
jgi:hypothetical protein